MPPDTSGQLVWGSAKENTPGKKAGRMVTFSSFVLSMAMSTFGL